MLEGIKISGDNVVRTFLVLLILKTGDKSLKGNKSMVFLI